MRIMLKKDEDRQPYLGASILSRPVVGGTPLALPSYHLNDVPILLVMLPLNSLLNNV